MQLPTHMLPINVLWDVTPWLENFGSWQLGFITSVALGFGIGIVSSVFGIGGGFVVTPWFHSVLGLSPVAAVGSSIAQMPLMGLGGLYGYAKRGLIRYRTGLWLLLGSVPSAQWVALNFGRLGDSGWGQATLWETFTRADAILLGTYVFVIGGLGVYNTIRSGQYKREEQKTEKRVAAWRITLIGCAVGCSAALIGIGGGFLAFPFFAYICAMPPVVAVATSLFVVAVTAVLTAIQYAVQGNVYLLLAGALGLGGVLGARLGVRVAVASKPVWLVRSLGLVQVLTAALYIWKES